MGFTNELNTIRKSFKAIFAGEIRDFKSRKNTIEIKFEDPISTFKLALALILALNLNVEICGDTLTISSDKRSFENCNVGIYASYDEIVKIEKEVHGLGRLEDYAKIKLRPPETPGLSRITITGKCSTKGLVILLYNFHKAGFTVTYIRENTITLTKTSLGVFE